MTLRYLILFLGFYVLSYGIVLSYRAELGVGPWTVLDIGIARNLGLTLGQANQLTGLLVIVAGYLLGIRPSLATFLNMFVIGEFIDVILSSPLCPPTRDALQDAGFARKRVYLPLWPCLSPGLFLLGYLHQGS